MVFEGFVWKTRPGACEEEPPVAGRRPWSTTVTSVQPRAEISSARAAPTTPAPMMTTRGPAIAQPPNSKPVQLLSAQLDSGCATQCACRRDGCQGVRDVGEQPVRGVLDTTRPGRLPAQPAGPRRSVR